MSLCNRHRDLYHMRVFERWAKVVYLGEFTFCGSSISCCSFSPMIILQSSVKALDGNNMDTKVNGNIVSASISAATSSHAVKCFPEGIYLISEPSKPHLLVIWGSDLLACSRIHSKSDSLSEKCLYKTLLANIV